MKKMAKQSPNSSMHVLCPFCGYPCDRTANLKWCGGCYVQWTVSKRGNLWFDTELKREEYIFAIAICKAGGVRFGNIRQAE